MLCLIVIIITIIIIIIFFLGGGWVEGGMSYFMDTASGFNQYFPWKRNSMEHVSCIPIFYHHSRAQACFQAHSCFLCFTFLFTNGSEISCKRILCKILSQLFRIYCLGQNATVLESLTELPSLFISFLQDISPVILLS